MCCVHVKSSNDYQVLFFEGGVKAVELRLPDVCALSLLVVWDASISK